MQVKKFEAKSMKEALELVKAHLGPEAIILSAKDSHRGFGLMGEKSVEVTAAVSEETLRKKKIAESKMREDLRQRFQQIPAVRQKAFINKVFTERETERREMAMAGGAPANPISADVRAQLKSMRYIDIVDEDRAPAPQASGHERVRSAAERARAASRDVLQDPPPPARRAQNRRPPAPISVGQMEQVISSAQMRAQAPVQAPIVTPAPTAAAPAAIPSSDIRALESQVQELKNLVERFQQMPQLPLSMHPGAEQGLPYELSAIYQRLTAQGIFSTSVTALLKRAMKEIDAESIKKPALVDAWVVRHLLNTVEVVQQPTQGRYHVFMGSTGQGKTSSLVKFASQLVMKEKKKIAIISLDSVKVGAADQLRIYAQVLNVPFAIVRNPEEWRVAEQKLAHVAHILVDAPGLNLRTMEEAEWLKKIIPPAEFDRRLHLVQSALARDEEATDIAERYQMIGFHDVIFTRLDESSRQGLLLNFQERFRKPIHSFGCGSKIPEDYEFATKERIVDFIFKLSRLQREETK
jgi:flagellar biosynthesis protein FlhF